MTVRPIRTVDDVARNLGVDHLVRLTKNKEPSRRFRRA